MQDHRHYVPVLATTVLLFVQKMRTLDRRTGTFSIEGRMVKLDNVLWNTVIQAGFICVKNIIKKDFNKVWPTFEIATHNQISELIPQQPACLYDC